ncbi:MAG: hypothetical protein QM747_17665 [Nocardioides sp.]
MDLDTQMRHQDGVVSRRQVLGAGWAEHDIERMLRRRRWARVFPGVYVDHTGVPTWRQRAWGATLLHEPAALLGLSALAAWGAWTPAVGEPISLAVAASRRVVDPPGVRTTRMRSWESVTQLQLSPPRTRLEVSALVAASAMPGDDSAVALLGDLVQRRRTTAMRLQTALATLPRLPRRRLLIDVLGDVTEGAWSALERRYLRDVERAHGLPRGYRQLRARPNGVLQLHDVGYEAYAVCVELDGRLGHELWQDRWDDLDRDLRSLTEGTITVRVGWGQVVLACRLAETLGTVLHARGWRGAPVSCGDGCPVSPCAA